MLLQILPFIVEIYPFSFVSKRYRSAKTEEIRIEMCRAYREGIGEKIEIFLQISDNASGHVY